MEDVGWLSGIAAVCFGCGCLFSVVSLSFRSYSKRRLIESSKDKDRAEQQARELSENSERLSIAARVFQLLFNTSALLLIVRAFSVDGALRSIELLFAFLIYISAVFMFTIALPQSVSQYRPESVIAAFYKPMKFLSKIIYPALYLFDVHDVVVMRLSGVQELTEEENQDEKHDEIMNIVEKSVDEGVVDNEEMTMIENILDLDQTTAIEIITPRTELVAVEADADFEKIVKTVLSAGHSRIPVYEERIDNIIGLIYAKDLLSQVGRDAEFSLRESMRPAYFVPETVSLRELLHEFQNKKQHMAVVLDEYGGVAGIVTIEDILEELVGEIEDEYERTAPASIKLVNDDVVELDAKVYVDDINRSFAIELPEDEDYDTVGGFVFSHLGYIPKSGETFRYNGLVFTVLASETRKIKRIRIEKRHEEKD
ncbi:MAG: hemolysin family protein [Phycisphaerae bacterium]